MSTEVLLNPILKHFANALVVAWQAMAAGNGWQLATALGNKLSGILAKLWDTYDDKSHFFWVNFVLLAAAALVLLAMLRWLNRIFKEQGIH